MAKNNSNAPAEAEPAAAPPPVQTSGVNPAPPEGTTSAPPETKPPATTELPAATPEQPTIEGEVGEAKKRLAQTLQACRESRVTDGNVIGQLENAFEDCKNTLAVNKATLATLATAAKALQVGATALANHSGTTPGVLSTARAAAAATQRAAEALKTAAH